MALEVAALTARLTFEHHGAEAATRAAETVAQSLQVIEQASQSASATTRRAGAALEETYNRVAAAQQRWAEVSAATGVSVEQLALGSDALAQSIARTQAEIDSAISTYISAASESEAWQQTALELASSLGKQAEETQNAVTQAEAYDEMAKKAQQRSEVLTGQLEAQIAAQEALGNYSSLDELLSELEKGAQLADEATASVLRFNATTATGLINVIRSGRFGGALLGQFALAARRAFAIAGTGAARAAASVKLLAIAFGLLPIGFIVKATKDILGLANAAAVIPDRIDAITDSMERLEGITDIDFAGPLQQAINQFNAVGFEEPEGAARFAARLAEGLQFLRPGQDDFAETFRAITDAIARVDATPLAEIGVDVQTLNDKLLMAADQGATRYQRAMILATEIGQHFAANLGEINAQLEKERNSLPGVVSLFREMVSAVAGSEEMETAMTNLWAAVRRLLVALAPLVELAGKLAIVLVKGLTFVINVALKLIDVWHGMHDALKLVAGAAVGVITAFNPILGIGIGLGLIAINEAAAGTEGVLSDIADIDANLSWLKDFEDGIGDIAESAEDAKQRVRDFFEENQRGFGITNQLRGLADAWGELDQAATGTTVFDVLQRTDQLIGTLVEDADALLKVRDNINSLREAGFIDENAFNVAMAAYESLENFAQPFIETAANIEREILNNESASERAAGSMRNNLEPAVLGIETAFNNGTTAVMNMTDAMHNIPSEVSTVVNVGLNDPNGLLSGGGLGVRGISGLLSGGGGAAQAPTDPRAFFVEGQPIAATPLPRTPTAPLSSTISAEDSSFIRRLTQQRVTTPEDVSGAAADVRRHFPSSRGGGGGGGGRDFLATLEEIQEFFKQVNSAILAGIRGGRVFSTAGNAIPLGGAGQFVSSQGGTLIEQVNLRGVWDFADPAAKREIVRQLREALASIGEEVA